MTGVGTEITWLIMTVPYHRAWSHSQSLQDYMYKGHNPVLTTYQIHRSHLYSCHTLILPHWPCMYTDLSPCHRFLGAWSQWGYNHRVGNPPQTPSNHPGIDYIDETSHGSYTDTVLWLDHSTGWERQRDYSYMVYSQPHWTPTAHRIHTGTDHTSYLKSEQRYHNKTWRIKKYRRKCVNTNQTKQSLFSD